MSGEEVLVIARDRVPDGGDWYGLRADGMDAFLATVAEHGRFAPRVAMEVDPAWKQVIPYPVLRDGDAWYLMRRTKAGSDARWSTAAFSLASRIRAGERAPVGRSPPVPLSPAGPRSWPGRSR